MHQATAWSLSWSTQTAQANHCSHMYASVCVCRCACLAPYGVFRHVLSTTSTLPITFCAHIHAPAQLEVVACQHSIRAQQPCLVAVRADGCLKLVATRIGVALLQTHVACIGFELAAKGSPTVAQGTMQSIWHQHSPPANTYTKSYDPNVDKHTMYGLD